MQRLTSDDTTTKETPARLFYQGRCEEVLADTVDDPDSKWVLDSVPYVIGSLCFLGRVEEAEIRVAGLSPNLSRVDQAACHFYLSVGWTRCSNYSKARSHIIANIKLMRFEGEKNSPPLLRFYVRQGLAFFRHFSSRYSLALHSAERALEASIQADNFFARMLATDLFGHARIETGEIARGLQDLELAYRLAQKLGHGDYAKAIHKALIADRSQFGLLNDGNLNVLMEVIQESKVQDDYTDNYTIIALVRQLTLRGRLSEAEGWLLNVSRSIYAKRNRRQRVMMNLCWAEIAFLRQDLDLVSDKLEAALSDIDKDFDNALYLRWQGLALKSGSHKCATVSPEQHRLGTEQVGSGLARRIYARENASVHPLAPGDDPLGDLIDTVSRVKGFKVELFQKIVQSGYLGLLRKMIPPADTARVIHLNLLPGTLIIMNDGDIFACDTGTSPKINELLKALSHGPRSKEDLVFAIWGYEYNPLRHDSLLYTLISRLRTLLGSVADWLENYDEGYQLRSDVQVVVREHHREPPTVQSESRIEEIAVSQLNMRQLAIIEHLKSNKKWLVPEDCVDLFQTSKVTATRDLSHLVKEGYLLRVGKGRATRYGLAEFAH